MMTGLSTATQERAAASAAQPPCFGFIVTRYPYHLWATYDEAEAAKASLAARSPRPSKLVIMKELGVNGRPAFFVTTYKYIQKRTLAEARIDFAKKDIARENGGRELTRRQKKLRRKQKAEDKRIRCIVNCSGAPAPLLVGEACEFFARELAGARGLNETERRALGLVGISA